MIHQGPPSFTASVHGVLWGVSLQQLCKVASPDGSTNLLQLVREREVLPWRCAPWPGIVLSCPGPILLFLSPPLRDRHLSSPSLVPLAMPVTMAVPKGSREWHSVKCGGVSLVASSGRTRVSAATDRLLRSGCWRWDRGPECSRRCQQQKGLDTL